MKGNRLYVLLLFGFLVVVFFYQYFSPKEFVWNPTFSKYDKQPFGSYVFDDVMSTSMTDYQVVNKTFYQLYDEIILSADERRAFLVTEDRINLAAVDITALVNLLNRGHTFMLCLNSFPRILCDSIGFSFENTGYYSVSSIARMAREGLQRDSMLLGVDSLIYTVYPQMHPGVLSVTGDDSDKCNNCDRSDRSDGCDSCPVSDTVENLDMSRVTCHACHEILVRNTAGKPLAMRIGMGEGELFIVATPLMFTNYGMLDGDNASYAFRLLSFLKDMPLTRIEAYNPFVNQASSSPLRYFLSQPPLRWALFISLISILLFMFFAAKRRQQVIPVVHPPANETLRFTQLIANLYYQRKDYKDMLQKKYLYFCTSVKQLNGLDLLSDEADEALCRRLTDKTGQDFSEIWPHFRELKYLLRDDVAVDETSMMRLINQMNEWTKNL